MRFAFRLLAVFLLLTVPGVVNFFLCGWFGLTDMMTLDFAAFMVWCVISGWFVGGYAGRVLTGGVRD